MDAVTAGYFENFLVRRAQRMPAYADRSRWYVWQDVGQFYCAICGEASRFAGPTFTDGISRHRARHWDELSLPIRAAIAAGAIDLALELYDAG
jgi:hypothetical protein